MMKTQTPLPSSHQKHNRLPRHVAIIMDGNGRWATQRHLPRLAGHKAGVATIRNIVETCGDKGIQTLSLFAFSSENWRRPHTEVINLLKLFSQTMKNEITHLHDNNIQLRFIGDLSRFSKNIHNSMLDAQALTNTNTGLQLVIALNYGGQWDILQATRSLATKVAHGELQANDINETLLATELSTTNLPAPDLLIRTSGEQRISNFFLWQCAYAELYFTNTLWPDFNKNEFEQALLNYAKRTRRFGEI